jgi:hypothetical protein
MAGSKRCAKCKKSFGLEQFPLKIQSSYGTTPSHTSTCFPCTPGVLSLKDFLVFLGRQKDVLSVEARITVGELSEYDDRRKRADAIVNLMWEVMSYRFLCVSMVLQLYYYNFT